MEKDNSMGKQVLHEMWEWVYAIVIALAVAILIHVFVGQITRVSGESMENTLHNGDFLIVSKWDHIRAIREHIALISEEAGREYKIVGDVDGAPAYEFMGATPDGSGSSVIIR